MEPGSSLVYPRLLRALPPLRVAPRLARLLRYAALDVPEVGDLRLVAADIPPGWPRGRVWTNAEIALLRTVQPDQQEARAVAQAKEIFGGTLVGAHPGDRGPAVALELAPMPHNTPTAKTRRYLDRGHGPRPGPQNFRL